MFKVLALAMLALLAILPNFISSMVWGSINVAFAIVVVSVMLFLAIKASKFARWSIIPLAAILTLPPYPYWIYADNSGNYEFFINHDGLKESIGFFSVLLVVYAVIFSLMYLVARRKPMVQ